MLRATPPGEDGLENPGPSPQARVDTPADASLDRAQAGFVEEGQKPEQQDANPFDETPSDRDFLRMVREADSQALHYVNQVNRASWERSYHAFHQEHFGESKYKSRDYANRSKFFIPKTRTAVRKDMAATAASLFGSIDAVNCMAGNEADPIQRASAAVLKELVNYRTDRASGKASMAWFHTAMGARQTSLLTGICLSKQYWKLELKRTGVEQYDDEDTGEKGERDVWEPDIDRPECDLMPPENFVIDPAADWRNPAQDAAYMILKYPMRIDEIRRKQRDPRNPWKELPESALKAGDEGQQMQMQSIRRAREQGLDRFDETQTARNFGIIWVWESFIRTAGQDWCFFSIGDKYLLTDPQPVEEVYPEQKGERPLVLGYGAFEAFRIFPMSNVEAWQQLQRESNDVRNLTLDALKQNIMPVTKVVRGKNVDLEQLKRRGQGSAIMVQNKDDVTWEQTPTFPSQVVEMQQKLDIEFDDLSGQQNYGTVNDNNNLGKTLGGLKLAAGAANAVQEFDIRIWIETWVEPVLSQIVKLEQFYESDPTVLELCGERAKMFQKYGIDQITDDMLERSIAVRVNAGLGAGDPQQRLAKFQSAVQVALPLLQLSPDFAQQKVVMDWEAVMEEVFGAAGYRDGGKRFIKQGQGQQQNPMLGPQMDALKAKTEKDHAQAKAAILTALANAAKVGLEVKALDLERLEAEFGMHAEHVRQLGEALDKGYQHGHDLADRKRAAAGLNSDGSPMLPPEGASPTGGGGMGGKPTGAGGGVAADSGAGTPQNAGHGNRGVDPSMLGHHSIPASDAGHQGALDENAATAQIARAAKKPNPLAHMAV
jgi:hypothetical protein